ncbi:hypothetical protein [Undibacterium pigrum]|jgi:hypothetical protein|uniref:Uncharacterized protein n=1 Tax=Undibacterium pigrum TaxID=401470 RepID=A0A318JX93_9BURK|nr:hypothetical protein [Undibacterium pigrum]PXX45335.1 hypothetical protein DFR42_102563 [Undibacterium pigrum]
MKNPITSNATTSQKKIDPKAQNEQDMRALTSEEIFAVAGGPEVDIETGTGGG